MTQPIPKLIYLMNWPKQIKTSYDLDPNLFVKSLILSGIQIPNLTKSEMVQSALMSFS